MGMTWAASVPGSCWHSLVQLFRFPCKKHPLGKVFDVAGIAVQTPCWGWERAVRHLLLETPAKVSSLWLCRTAPGTGTPAADAAGGGRQETKRPSAPPTPSALVNGWT